MFGRLGPGMAFGELAMANPLNESKTKFYNAITLNECILLQISKADFDNIFKA